MSGPGIGKSRVIQIKDVMFDNKKPAVYNRK